MTYDLDRYLRRFEDFTRGFMRGREDDDAGIHLKIYHSLRVLDESRAITRSLSLSPLESELSQLVALFHDIGRFPQYARYKTFNDRISTNHARLGVDTILETGILFDLNAEDRRLILGAIYLHNRFALPQNLSRGLDLQAKIIRDSDKLDIARILLTHFESDAHSNNLVTLGLKTDPFAWSPDIVADIRSQKQVRYEGMVWVNDFKLLVSSWTYDLNFAASRQAALQRGYIDRLFAQLPPNAELQSLKAQLQDDMYRRSKQND
ncbi:MAG: HD domain-containing protein [Candidatus Latescibacterota bacterium]